jgi:hypothetical protein
MIIESSRGKYHVLISAGQVVIEAKKEDSPYYVKQSVFIENVEDLKDLFVTIASVLNQVYDSDTWNQ